MVTITNKLSETAISLFENETLKSLKELNNFSKIFRALKNEYNRKILIALQKSRLSTVFDLKRITEAPNKEIIQGKILSLTSYGFIDIKHSKADDYWIYRRYWKQQHPNSHGDPNFLVPTEYTQRIYDAFVYTFEDLFSESKIYRLETIGQFFRKFYENQMEQLGDSDEIPELLKRKLIGSCCICGEQLFSTAKHEEFQGELYCQNCVYELYKDRRYLQEKL